MLVRVFCFFI